MASKALPSVPRVAGASVTYRDTTHTSRTLILPGDRTLPVIRGLVTIGADDDAAREYLDSRADMQKQE